MRTVQLVFFSCLWCCNAIAQSFLNPTGVQVDGKYKVGFELVEKFDSTRVYQKNVNGNPFRPMQVAIWYPTSFSDSHSLSLGDYIRIGARSETLSQNDSTEEANIKEFLNSSHIDSAKAKYLIKADLEVYLGATPQVGDFPIVIYAPGSSANWYDNFMLCQSLASNGYIVASIKSRSLKSPSMSMNWVGVESQVRDMEFALREALVFSDDKEVKVNVIGRSWGAISALVFSIRNEAVTKTLSSLDGTLSYNAVDLLKDSPYPNADFVRVPILLTVGKKRAEGSTPIDRNAYYKAVKYADAYHASYDKMRHTAFGSFYLYYHYLLNVKADEKTSNDLVNGYISYSQHIFSFLDHYNKGQNPLVPEVREGHYEIFYESRSNKKLSDYQDFSYQLEVNGPDAASDLYFTVKAVDSIYAKNELFNPSYINAQAYRCLSSQNIKSAIKTLKIGLDAYPDNSNLYDSLGDMYYRDGSFVNSVEAYRKSLELDHSNKNASRMIKKITSSR